jgi:hypothetical protein
MGLFTQPVRTRHRPHDLPRLSHVQVIETESLHRLVCPCCRVTFDYGADCPVCQEGLVDTSALAATTTGRLCTCGQPATPREVALNRWALRAQTVAQITAMPLIFAGGLAMAVLTVMSKIH